MYNYRVDWIDYDSDAHCVDFLTRDSAIWEAKNDILGEIFSITGVDDEGNESANLLEFFKNF